MTSTRSFSFNRRAALRRALLAAGETCWVYAIVLTVSAFAQLPRVLAPSSLFITYLVGMFVGACVPRQLKPGLAGKTGTASIPPRAAAFRRAWRAVQWLAIIGAALTILLVIRLDLYQGTPLADLSWLSTLSERLFRLLAKMTPEQLATLALLYVYVRGLGLAQRPLTLWFVGYQFRLGVVVFFGAAFFAALIGGVEFRSWILVYFVLALSGIALARIEEAGREMALGGKWALVLGGAILATVGVGLLLTQVLTLQTAETFFGLFWPLVLIFEAVLAVVLFAATLALSGIIDVLTPFFGQVGEMLDRFYHLPPQTNEAAQQAVRVIGQLAFLVPYLRVLVIAALVFGVGLIIARALNRRMNQLEAETFVREHIGARETFAAARQQRVRAQAAPARALEAENVRRIYAALLAHVARLGLARRAAETPLEFLPRLSTHWPAAADDLRAITDAYVAVHYAQRPASSAQVRALRAVWQRVRGQLVKP